MIIEFLAQYGLFLAKAITVVAAILIAGGGLATLLTRQKGRQEKHLEITHLNKQYEEMENALSSATLTEAGMKLKMKADKKRDRKTAKSERRASKSARTDSQDAALKKRLFVVDFSGDIRASAVSSLRQEISAILTVATERDEVLVRLESGGGTVQGYGLGASQLQRVRNRGIALTVSVDKVAASGGYMMACVGSRIIAAPFAVIGSIGVLAQIPNLHRLLKEKHIDFEQLHAGEYKRTLTLFGENTEKGRRKMQEDLEEIHHLFKDFVKRQRPDLDMEKTATGEHWLGVRALELGLVDELKTSDDYLMEACSDADLVMVEYRERKNLMERLNQFMSFGLSRRHDGIREMERPFLM